MCTAEIVVGEISAPPPMLITLSYGSVTTISAYQSIDLSIENRVIFLDVFFWNSTLRSFTLFTALYEGILALTILTCSSK